MTTETTQAQSTETQTQTSETQQEGWKHPKAQEREAWKVKQAEIIRKAEAEKAQSKEPVKEKAEQKETAAERKLRLKIDGQEEELSESEVIKLAQMSKASQKRFQEAQMSQRQAQQFIELLKTNPRAVLEHPALGVDLKAMAEEIIWQNLQQAAKSPEEIEREKERQELEQYRKEKAEAEARRKQEASEQLKEKYRQDWSKKFTETLDSAGVPKTDWTVQRMAAYMRQALAKGYKHIQPSDVVDMVKADWIAAQKQMFSSLDGDKLIDFLGKDVVEKLRKAELKRFDDPRFNQRENSRSEEKTQKTYGSVEEMLRNRK